MSFGRIHLAWPIAGLTFLLLMIAAGIRFSTGVLVLPMERELGWSRVEISTAIAVGLFVYGASGPFAAAMIQAIGARRTVIAALLLLAASLLATTQVASPWHMIATWGVLLGIGSGVLNMPLGVSITNKWFAAKRGLVTGLIAASAAGGQLLMLPPLAALASAHGWKPVVVALALGALALVPLSLWLLRDDPRDVGLRPYGADPGKPLPAPASATSAASSIALAFATLGECVRRRDYWLLQFTFLVCGLSTAGLVTTHLVAYCFDNGIPEVTSAALLGMMGVLNFFGAMMSGWLSDRFDSRWLLFWYYGLRGLSLLFLPFSGFNGYTLTLFAIFFGLDWIATVPPTVRLVNNVLGPERAPIVFAWLVVGHQIGSALAAFGAGFIRTSFERYLEAFVISGLACLAAALVALLISRRPIAPKPIPAPQPA